MTSRRKFCVWRYPPGNQHCPTLGEMNIIFKSAFERGYVPKGLTIVRPSHALEQVGTYLEQLTHMAHDSEARLGRCQGCQPPPKKGVVPECWNARQHGNYLRYIYIYIWKWFQMVKMSTLQNAGLMTVFDKLNLMMCHSTMHKYIYIYKYNIVVLLYLYIRILYV